MTTARLVGIASLLCLAGLLGAAPRQDAAPARADDTAEHDYERWLEAEHWRAAKVAAEALVAHGEEATRLLCRGAEDAESSDVRRRCYELMIASFPTERDVLRTVWNDGLADELPAIRYMCAFHLGEQRVFESFHRLRRTLGDTDPWTRIAAAKSLAELGDAEGLPVLYDAVGSDDYMPRSLANRGLKALTGKDLDDFDYDFAEGAFVSGGVEAKHERRPIEDARTRAARFTAIAAYFTWLRDEHPEYYKHVDGGF